MSSRRMRRKYAEDDRYRGPIYDLSLGILWFFLSILITTVTFVSIFTVYLGHGVMILDDLGPRENPSYTPYRLNKKSRLTLLEKPGRARERKNKWIRVGSGQTREGFPRVFTWVIYY